MPELTRTKIQDMRKAWLEFHIRNLENLTEGAKSDLIPHEFEIKMMCAPRPRLGEEIIRQCTYCNIAQSLRSKELDEKYCRGASIILARTKGTFNPDYQEDNFY